MLIAVSSSSYWKDVLIHLTRKIKKSDICASKCSPSPNQTPAPLMHNSIEQLVWDWGRERAINGCLDASSDMRSIMTIGRKCSGVRSVHSRHFHLLLPLSVPARYRHAIVCVYRMLHHACCVADRFVSVNKYEWHLMGIRIIIWLPARVIFVNKVIGVVFDASKRYVTSGLLLCRQVCIIQQIWMTFNGY